MLKILNSINNKKEFFISKSKIVNIYVCGITVYDYCHIGHARTFYFFDILLRYLKYLGYKCFYIRNITDFSDKLIYKSYKYNICIKKLSKLMIENMDNDFNKLGFIKPNYEPKVSDYIDDIIINIKYLLKKKYAFISNNGDVLFNIKNIKKNDDIFINYKITNNFVLWKLNINSKNIIIGWNSPWGKGRPGWHIECSVISNKFFSDITIHGGGNDLLFPHHKNEYIISKCLFKKKYSVKYWLHTGIVINNNNKLSKSKNNFFLIKDLLKIYNSDIIKYFLMSVHYRKNLIFSYSKIRLAQLAIKKIYLSLKNLNLDIFLSKKDFFLKKIKNYFNLFMNDDFNIPKIYKLFFIIVKKINLFKKKNNFLLASKFGVILKKFANIIGLFKKNINKYYLNNSNKKSNSFNIKRINKLVNLRNKARILKKWKIADWIRKKLLLFNISINDNKNYSDWYFN